MLFTFVSHFIRIIDWSVLTITHVYLFHKINANCYLIEEICNFLKNRPHIIYHQNTQITPTRQMRPVLLM